MILALRNGSRQAPVSLLPAFESTLSNLNHPLHAVAANDVDRFGCADAVAAARADIFAGAARLGRDCRRTACCSFSAMHPVFLLSFFVLPYLFIVKALNPELSLHSSDHDTFNKISLEDRID